eukprot:8191893-Prorocentrum_lima.AAC.1
MSAGEDDETCLVYQLALQRRQGEEHQRQLTHDQMNVAGRGEQRGDELDRNPECEAQVMSPNSAGVGSSE